MRKSGVIGEALPRYNIWGDCVNTARSREREAGNFFPCATHHELGLTPGLSNSAFSIRINSGSLCCGPSRASRSRDSGTDLEQVGPFLIIAWPVINSDANCEQREGQRKDFFF